MFIKDNTQEQNMSFSVPYFPFLNPEEIVKFIEFLKINKKLIFDIYCTIRIPPFNNDAMGINFNNDLELKLIENAIIIQNETGIKISATFNDITISPSYENYLLFIKNFRPYYEKGIKSITIPFTSWLRFGLKKEFPDLFIKNTILNKVCEASDVYNLYTEGFDYINLDRYLIRNGDRLKEIKKAQTKFIQNYNKKVYLSLLMNENCEGHCPVQRDHFLFNIKNEDNSKTFFKSEMKTISCEGCNHKKEDILYKLKCANIWPLYNELNYYFSLVDVIKLHGRESKNVFFQTLSHIENINKKDIIDINDINLIKTYKLNKWLEYIKNCKFNCFNCSLCEDYVILK